MMEERDQRKTNEVKKHVANEGNVRGPSSSPGILLIGLLILIGIALIYMASS